MFLGFVADAIVHTMAPILAQQLGWTSVIRVCRGCRARHHRVLLTMTNQSLGNEAGTLAQL